jgi:hypothetical protein
MNQSSREIEREVEASRARIEDTMDAIRDRMTLGQMVDEATHYFGTSGVSRAAGNLGAQVRDNPLPLALVGLGLAWLMSGKGRPHVRSSADGGYRSRAYDGPDAAASYGGQPGEEADENGDGASLFGGMQERFDDASGRMGEAADAARSALGSAADRVGDTAHTLWNSGRAGAGSGGRMGARAYDTAVHRGEEAYAGLRNGFLDLLEREPLAIGALGVAVGAAIGAMLPSTRTEDRYLGEARDDLLERTGDTMQRQARRADHIAQSAFRAAAEEAEARGLTPEGLQENVRSVAESARDAAAEAAKESSPQQA